MKPFQMQTNAGSIDKKSAVGIKNLKIKLTRTVSNDFKAVLYINVFKILDEFNHC